ELNLFAGGTDLHFAAGEEEFAEAEAVKDVDGLHERVGPVDDAGVGVMEEVVKAAAGIAVEEEERGAVADFEVGFGDEVEGAATVDEFEDAGIEVDRAMKAGRGIVGGP